MKYDVVIIGAGHAGGMVAIFLRKFNFQGSIVIIGDGEELPYQKPALSKGFLTGAQNQKSLFLKTREYYSKNNIVLILNSSIEDIDKNNKLLALENGKIINYEKLVISTGAKLKTINIDQSSNNTNPIYLRTINDSKSIKGAFNKAKSIGIIGGGYIGLEIASAAIQKKLDVKILESENRILGRVASEILSEYIQNLHEKKGVDFFLNSKINKVNSDKKNNIIYMSKDNISVDLIVAGVGIKPNISLAENAGLNCKNGIVVDKYCLTSNKNIFAVGDCANQYHEFYNKYLRLESVHNAVEQAKLVAQKVSKTGNTKTVIPWFWSDQYDVKLQIVGIGLGEKCIVRGSKEKNKFSVFNIKDNKVSSVESVNDPSNFMLAKKLILNKKTVISEQIEDESFNLKML